MCISNAKDVNADQFSNSKKRMSFYLYAQKILMKKNKF